VGLLKPNKESKRKIVIGLFLLWGSGAYSKLLFDAVGCRRGKQLPIVMVSVICPFPPHITHAYGAEVFGSRQNPYIILLSGTNN
jgi:hypothetical protein